MQPQIKTCAASIRHKLEEFWDLYVQDMVSPLVMVNGLNSELAGITGIRWEDVVEEVISWNRNVEVP